MTGHMPHANVFSIHDRCGKGKQLYNFFVEIFAKFMEQSQAGPLRRAFRACLKFWRGKKKFEISGGICYNANSL